MAFIDYYKVLGIDRSATEADIKKAYRKIARKYHPDVNPNDKTAEAKFKEANEANEVLSNVENRKKYDAHGADWKHADEIERQRSQRQQHQHQQQNTSFNQSDYSDFFESMFGGGPSRDRGSVKFRGQDYHTELSLLLRDVYTTHKRTITVNGKNIRLTIPAGVHNGQQIKIAGHGGEGINGGPNGDLYLQFNITNDTPFRRDKDDLHLNADLDLYLALLGGQLIVDTYDGKVKLTVEPETVTDTKVKLKGKGFPIYKKVGHFGNLIITYKLKLPTNLSLREKELLVELAKHRTP